ncbi:ABC-2 family transporter protein [Chloroflexi bacterium TSY]|nr:ABC-2 family transporter protein [Chloroflexi bacterium TSY]
MNRLRAELRFFSGLFALNLAAAMEYRASFISQIVGMFINNGIYFVFWIIFFDRFGQVRGYGIGDIYLLFAVITTSFGLAFMIAGNAGPFLANIIAQGRLDYYLVLPRQLLLHVILSRMSVSTIGDLSFGLIAFFFAGRFHPIEILLFGVTCLFSALILVGFAVVAGSLAFYMGNAQHASQQMINAILTFSLYPQTLFSGATRFLLLTLLPAAFVGAIPVEIIKTQNGITLISLLLAVVVVWVVASAIFYLGLRRYESGSAINVNV